MVKKNFIIIVSLLVYSSACFAVPLSNHTIDETYNMMDEYLVYFNHFNKEPELNITKLKYLRDNHYTFLFFRETSKCEVHLVSDSSNHITDILIRGSFKTKNDQVCFMNAFIMGMQGIRLSVDEMKQVNNAMFNNYSLNGNMNKLNTRIWCQSSKRTIDITMSADNNGEMIVLFSGII